jgi:hypothetical protein
MLLSRPESRQVILMGFNYTVTWLIDGFDRILTRPRELRAVNTEVTRKEKNARKRKTSAALLSLHLLEEPLVIPLFLT